MRFRYIDSQGKEVPIPTVDALALRIELGAITESTRFYDSGADRWAPAGEHEIFRSLSRELAEKSGGFVAPPPPSPVAPPPMPPQAAPDVKAPSPFDALERTSPPPAASPAPLSAPPTPPPAPSKPQQQPAQDDTLGGLDFGLTLEAPVAGTPNAADDRNEADPFGLGDTGQLPPSAPPAAEKRGDTASGGSGFDFSGFGGMLTEDEDDDEEDAPAFGGAAPSGDLGLEGAMSGASYDLGTSSRDHGVAPGGGRDGMMMEQPLSDMPLDDGGWMQKEEEPEPPSRAPESTPTQRFRADEDAPPPERKERPERPARPRPSPPPPPPAKSGVPALIGVVAVVALLGAGGWFGFSKFMNRAPAEAAPAEPVDPPVSIPELAESLQPRMRELSTAAKADWLALVRTGLAKERALPVEPDREWLGGSYLADASKYASIEQYWKGLDDYLADLQARDETLFVGAVSARMDTLAAQDGANALSDADRTSITNRLRAGFQVGRADRRAVYRKLQAVIDAALGLHAFLLANEDHITYDPAAGGSSRDPVLEAVPDTPALGKEMWSLVDRITESLDGLGALDRVTTDRLLELVSDQLGAVPIR